MKNSELESYMRKAIEKAKDGATPYGALLLDNSNGNYIVRANTTTRQNKIAHAEMNVLMDKGGLNADPSNLILFTTGEPCPMCMGAIIWSRIQEIYFGLSIIAIKEFHHQIQISSRAIADQSWFSCKIEGGILKKDCLSLFQEYA